MNGKMYQDIIDKYLLPSTRMMKMKRAQTVQQDNDLKQTAKELNCFQRMKMKLLEWPSQPPDLNPTENQRKELKITEEAHRTFKI